MRGSSVSLARLAHVLSSAQQACAQLLQDALDGGGSDNLTVIVGRTMPKDG
jgi:serine/threonine protein phosphatase PrpC